MILKVLGSSSKGNCYLLQGKNETLILEAGVSVKEVKKALNFNLHTVVGCLVSHEHGDHASEIKKLQDCGIDIFSSKGTFEALGNNHHRSHYICSGKSFTLRGFTIVPFSVEHDCNEPLGFLMHHPECGKVLFATDTYFIQHRFTGLNNIIIECNYSHDILDENIASGAVDITVRNRVIASHMELQTCKEFLNSNSMADVENIVLCHLSGNNSDGELFRQEIRDLTRRNVYVAENGLEIEFNKDEF